MLLWLIAPLVAVSLLRAFGGDGWQDFGIRPKLRAQWKWYVGALCVVPIVTVLMMALGVSVGAISLNGFAEKGIEGFIALVGITFGGAMVKNIFEEFAWRGYVTPRLDALKIHPLLNHALTGVVWWGWHLPYWFYFLNRAEFAAHTSLDLNTFVLLSFVLLQLYAIPYGELRLASQSVWPVWHLHNIANVFSLALLSGYVTLRGGLGVILSPGTEGIFTALVFGAIGIGMYVYRMRTMPRVSRTRASQVSTVSQV